MRARVTEAGRALSPLFLYDPVDYWLGELEPTWVRRERRARVVSIEATAEDTRTFVLETAPGRWAGHRPGQFVSITVEIDGRRHTRCYTVSSAPAKDRLAITVRRHPGGLVSGYLHERLRPGALVAVGDPQGELTLPDATERALLVAGGSGVTPTRSILEDLAARRSTLDLEVLYFDRSEAHVVLDGALLGALAERCPNVRVRTLVGPDKPRLTGESLASLVPDLGRRTALACGPESLLEAVTAAYAAAGRLGRLRVERFAPKTPERVESGEAVLVTLARSKKTLRLDGQGSLLEQLERGGVTPKSGCRMGICHTCRCRKLGGAVVDARTGQLQEEPDESIQLCVSHPRSDLVLDL